VKISYTLFVKANIPPAYRSHETLDENEKIKEIKINYCPEHTGDNNVTVFS
jgi:hypothetical protein